MKTFLTTKATKNLKLCEEKHCKSEKRALRNQIRKDGKAMDKKCGKDLSDLKSYTKCAIDVLKKQRIASERITKDYAKCITKKCKKEKELAKKDILSFITSKKIKR